MVGVKLRLTASMENLIEVGAGDYNFYFFFKIFIHKDDGEIRKGAKAFLGVSFAFLERINQSQMDTNPCWFPRMEDQRMTIIPSPSPYRHYLTPHVCSSPPPHQSPKPQPHSLSHSLTHSWS